MRFALLAAGIAACALSAPANSSVWTYNLTAVFDFTVFGTRQICAQVSPACYQDFSEHKDVTHTYQVQIQTGNPGNSVFTGVTQLGGYTYSSGYDYITTLYTFFGNGVNFDSASFAGSGGPRLGCVPGYVGCSTYSANANARSIGAAFVGSNDGTAPVPEPATWAMMIGGFGLTGSAMRRRRSPMPAHA